MLSHTLYSWNLIVLDFGCTLDLDFFRFLFEAFEEDSLLPEVLTDEDDGEETGAIEEDGDGLEDEEQELVVMLLLLFPLESFLDDELDPVLKETDLNEVTAVWSGEGVRINVEGKGLFGTTTEEEVALFDNNGPVMLIPVPVEVTAT